MNGYCRPWVLTAAHELVALENMAVLQRNGFEVELEVDSDEPAGRRLRLFLAQPVSKNTEFDVQGKDRSFFPRLSNRLLPDIDLLWGVGHLGDVDLETSYLLRDRPCARPRRAQCLRCAPAARARWVGAPLNAKRMRTVSFLFCFSRFFTSPSFVRGC